MIEKSPTARRAGVLASAAMLLMSAVFAPAATAQDSSAGAAAPADSEEKALQSNDRMSAILDPLNAEALNLLNLKKYKEALDKCAQAEYALTHEIYEDTPYIINERAMVAQLRKDILAAWGKELMDPVHAEYNKAVEEISSNPAQARAGLKKVIGDLDKVSQTCPTVAAEAKLLSDAASATLNSEEKFGDVAIFEKVKLDRKAAIAEKINPIISDAEALLAEKKFKQAMARTVEASSTLEDLQFGSSPVVLAKKSEIVRLRADIANQWERAYVAQCRQDYLDAVNLASTDMKSALDKANAAMNTAREGMQEIPGVSTDLQDIEKACKDLVESEKFQEATALSTLDTELEERHERIRVMLSEGETYYTNKMYEKAKDSYEQILVLDPFNKKATEMLNKIYRKLFDTAAMRRENEALERINEVEWKWNSQIASDSEQIVDDRAPEESSYTEKFRIYEKLRTIVIPEVSFESTRVSDILDQLRIRSKDYDTAEHNGVNLIFSGSEDDNKEITMSLTNVPLGEILRYVCLYSGLKYSVAENSITVGPAARLDLMEMRSFRMSVALYNKISGKVPGSTLEVDLMDKDSELTNPFEEMLSGGGSGNGKGGGSDAGASAKGASANMGGMMGGMMGGSGSSEKPEDLQLKDFFMACGVPFGKGSSVTFDNRACKLFVKNTPENMKLIETLLRQIDVMTPLVLVEAKVIEVAMSDIEELGFNWNITHQNDDTRFMTANGDVVGRDEYGTSYVMGGDHAITQPLVRHAEGTGDSSQFNTTAEQAMNVISDMSILPNFGPNGAYNVFLSVSAVDQASRGEVLSAPKVIAYSDTEAEVDIVQEMYFPETWSEPEVNSNNNTYEYTPPYPEFGDAQKIGVTFWVKPTVSANNRTITMEIKPRLSTLVDWQDYSYEIKIGSISSLDETDAQYQPNMKMPILGVRQLDTKMKVYDGETVVLGGILTEDNAKRDDQYPFLGEVPLVGRLFKSLGEKSTKRNMLIFVTPRMMKLDGTPLKENKDRGLFDFDR